MNDFFEKSDPDSRIYSHATTELRRELEDLQRELDHPYRGMSKTRREEMISEVEFRLGELQRGTQLSMWPKLTMIASAMAHDLANSSDLLASTLNRPPKSCSYLLYFFLSKRDRCVVPGDLAEEYVIRRQDFGKFWTDVWYWKQVLCSIWPVLRNRIVKMAVLSGLIKGVSEVLRRITN